MAWAAVKYNVHRPMPYNFYFFTSMLLQYYDIYYIIVFDELHTLRLANLVKRIVCFLYVANILYIKSVHLLDIIQYCY